MYDALLPRVQHGPLGAVCTPVERIAHDWVPEMRGVHADLVCAPRLDDELDEESTNPVQNSAITKVILENEETVAAALNDLNDRKADRTELAELEDTIENHETRITTVEEAIETLSAGGITGVTETGSGNVIVSITKDGLNVKATKGTVSADDRVLNTTFTAYTASTQTVLAGKR